MPSERPVTFSVAARVVAGLGGLLLFGVLAVLVAVLLSLEGTRDEVASTRAKLEQTDARVQRLSSGFGPVLDAVMPIVSKASRREVRRTARQLTDATGRIPALAGDVDSTVGIVGAIAREVEAGNLRGSLSAVRDLAGTLVPAGERASSFLSGLDVPGARSVSACDERLKTRAPARAGQIGCLLRLMPNIRGVLKAQRRLLRRSLDVQTATRDGTGDVLALLRDSLAVQRELLVHIRSLDAKTGGTVPAATAP